MQIFKLIFSKYISYLFFYIVIAISTLPACSVGSPVAVSTVSERPLYSSTLPATQTLTLTPSTTSTATSTATPTPTITLTPTPSLLVLAGTPLPNSISVITSGNSGMVSALADWYEPGITDLTWSSNGQTLAIANTSGINLYDVISRNLTDSLSTKNQGTVSIAFSPDRKWLVAGVLQGSESEGYYSNLELWIGPNWSYMGVLYGAQKGFSSMAFTPDSQIMAAAYASSVYDENAVDFWITSSWKIRDILFTGPVLVVAISNDGSLMATTPDRYAIKIWDLFEEELLSTWHTSFTGAVNTLEFSPTGLNMSSGHYDGILRLWDINTGEVIHTIDAESVVQSIAYSPDGRIIATGGSYENGLIKLWDIGTGFLLHTLPGHTSGVDHLEFSPDGTLLVSGSYDGSIIIWGIRP